MENSPPLITIHLITACIAVGLGIGALVARKGSTLHKACGGAWAVVILTVAISSFWIREIGGLLGFSWLHLLSGYTIWSVCSGVWHIRAGNLPAHRAAMRGTFVGLCIAGGFALWPGRRFGNLVWGALGLY